MRTIQTMLVIMVLLLISSPAFAQRTAARNALKTANILLKKHATLSVSSDQCTLRLAYKADTHLRGRLKLLDVRRPNPFRAIPSTRKVNLRCEGNKKCAITTFHGRSNYKRSWSSPALSGSHHIALADNLNTLVKECRWYKFQRPKLAKPVRSKALNPAARPIKRRSNRRMHRRKARRK